MTAIIRGRNCELLTPGLITTTAVDSAMRLGGWLGGQGVQWCPSLTDDSLATYSTGLWGGLMLFGSDEPADQYTGMTRQFTTYGYGVILLGGAIISTSTYERYTYASRVGGPPYAPLVYQPEDLVYFSMRGYITNEDELSISGSPLAPAQPIGYVVQVPVATRNNYLTIQTTL